MFVQIYRGNVMKKTRVCKRVTRFSEGRESITDEEMRTASKEQN
jgi:hypothetical protein